MAGARVPSPFLRRDTAAPKSPLDLARFSMAAALSMFCAHKRLRTACSECTPTLRPPSALVEDAEQRKVTRRR